jgi:glycosyltransferase involved in cell wall biosynthesis
LREGIQHVAWSVRDVEGKRRDLATLREQLQALLAPRPPHLVHANSLSMTRIAAPVIRKLGIPGLGHVRDIVRLSAAAVRDVNGMSRLLAVSEATRRFHVAQGVDTSRVWVLYNGVDLKAFAGRAPRYCLRKELALPWGAILVVTVGQICFRKGTDVFVELARCIAADRSDVHFLVVGERTSNKAEARRLESELWAKAALPPCAGKVHFLGTRSDIAEVLPQVDLVVHAARQEPLGRVLLESAAAGRAIVATDVGGTPEIFPPASRSAMLVPPCDVSQVITSELLATTRRLLEDSGQRRELGAAARRRALQQFDARSAGMKLARHYCELLSTA